MLALLTLIQFVFTFCVDFKTQVGQITVQVNETWAPLGAQRFKTLVDQKFYEDSAFFRVVPNFVVQFGISGYPKINEIWGNNTIPDDPVLVSNLKGTVSYATAGPNTRTTELFINTVDNPRLDASGFAPFAKVVKGFEHVNQIVNPTPGNKMGIDQDKYSSFGNRWIRAHYPNVTFIQHVKYVKCP
ncbi:hypothetical protein HK103_000343 [Boothiomyces macroporosus]|uniref:Peptidyl-prolyl cis-trans isomerase n=1 Tax=Boothiomyces macroporosus TaxID=261099 RepID=A0AAD5UCK5_9FUNG|nr:hypothetical protein HK103_000343 [Boothiomyces macroporosus]